jgi:hypothetical protein
MLIPNKHSGYSKDGIRLYHIDSGGGGGGPTTSTTQTSNIPEYARPYVETMLGSAQNELFNYKDTIDPVTGATVKTPTDLKGYRAFGGTYDESGKQTGYDVDKYFSGFQPLQERAMGSAKELGPTQQTMDASNLAAQAGARAMGTQYQGGQFGNTYQGLQNYAPGQYNQQSVSAPRLQNYQMQGPADVQSQGYNAATMQGAQSGYNPQLQTFQMGPAERVGSQNFGGQTAQDYMSPYMQNVVDVQQAAAQRQADIDATQRGANAARSGAYGGSRQAVMDAEAARALASQKGSIQATGLQAAFANAQQQFNADQARQQAAQQANQQAGLTVGQQNLASQQATQNLGAGQIGLQTSLANLNNQQQAAVQNQAAQNQAMGMNAQQALQAALANQQTGLSVGQQNLNANLGIQSLGAGQNLAAQQANQQTNLATQQAQQAANQYGYGQQMANQQNLAQYGQAANALNAQQQQFGANLGIQGIQAANQAAGTLGTLGQQQYGQQQGAIDTQNRLGTQQQQFEQAKIDQQIKDYANQQQYSMQQLGNMNSLLRGLPMQSTTTQTYQAAPSGVSQLAGLGTTAAAAYGLSGAGKAKGGRIRSGLDHLGIYNAMKK